MTADKELSADVDKRHGEGGADSKPSANGTETARSAEIVRSGTSYPYYDLPESVRVADAIQHVGGSEATDIEVATKLGLTSLAGRGWTYRLSSAKEFGLVTRSGRGDGARVALTSLARELLRPDSEEHARSAKMRAFLTPKLYQALIERYLGAPVPEVKGLANRLIRDHGIVETVATNAAQSFIDSAKYAAVLTGDGRFVTRMDLQKDGADVSGDSPTAPSPPTPTEENPAAPSASNVIVVPTGFTVHQIPLRKDLMINVALPDDFSVKDFARMKKYLDFILYKDEEDDPIV